MPGYCIHVSGFASHGVILLITHARAPVLAAGAFEHYREPSPETPLEERTWVDGTPYWRAWPVQNLVLAKAHRMDAACNFGDSGACCPPSGDALDLPADARGLPLRQLGMDGLHA